MLMIPAKLGPEKTALVYVALLCFLIYIECRRKCFDREKSVTGFSLICTFSALPPQYEKSVSRMLPTGMDVLVMYVCV
jgi:hypothetical protein